MRKEVNGYSIRNCRSREEQHLYSILSDKEKNMRKNAFIASMLSVALASFAWGQSNANGIGYFALEAV